MWTVLLKVVCLVLLFCPSWHRQYAVGMPGNNDESRRVNMSNLLSMLNLEDGSSVIHVQTKATDLDATMMVEDWARNNNFYHLSTDIEHLNTFLQKYIQAVLAKNKNSISKRMLNFVVTCESENISAVLTEIHEIDEIHGRKALLRHFSKWLFIMNSSLPEFVDTYLDNVAFAVQTSTLNNCTFPACASIYTLLWTKEGRNLSYVTDTDIPYKEQHDVFPNARLGLNGRRLNIGILTWWPYCIKKNISNDTSESYGGACKELLECLGRDLNFTYELQEPEDKSWGGGQQGNTWPGLFGMVTRNEVDMSALPYGANQEREAVVTSSCIVVSSTYEALYRELGKATGRWRSLVSCFKWDVYVVGLVTLLWCSVLYCCLTRTDHATKREESLYTTYCMIGVNELIRVTLRQGTENVPSRTPIKLLYTFWWLFCIIITSVYTGNLIAVLTADKTYIPFTNLEELAEKSEFNVFVEKGSYADVLILSRNRNSLFRKLRERILKTRNAHINSSAEEVKYYTDLVKYKYNVYLNAKLTVQPLNDSELRSTDLNLKIPLYLPFPKYSPLAELFSNRLMWLYDSGIIEFWMSQTVGQTTTHPAEKSRDPIQLNIVDLQSALVACSVGVLTAVIFLGTEHFVQSYRLKRMPKLHQKGHVTTKTLQLT